jgi:hypothetical protein
MGGKKWDGFSCPHSPANDPSAPFCHSVEFQGRFSKERGRPRPQASPRPTLSFGLAKRWVAKNGMDSPANNPPFLSANPRQRFQGRIGRRMEAKEWLHRIISVAGRLRTPSSASLSMTDSVVWAGKKIGGKKQDHSPALILLPMIHPLRSAAPLNSKAG